MFCCMNNECFSSGLVVPPIAFKFVAFVIFCRIYLFLFNYLHRLASCRCRVVCHVTPTHAHAHTLTTVTGTRHGNSTVPLWCTVLIISDHGNHGLHVHVLQLFLVVIVTDNRDVLLIFSAP